MISCLPGTLLIPTVLEFARIAKRRANRRGLPIF